MKKAAPLYLLVFITAFSSCRLDVKDCEDMETVTVPPYKLVRTKCMGPGGPPSFRIKLYRGSEFLGQDVYLDSCVAHSQVSNDLFLLIDTCEKTFTEIRPDKKPIEAVDSIQIFSTLLQQTKTLSHEQSKIFVEDWNKSTPSDYREEPVDSVFFPNYDYKLTVFTQSGKREFLADYYLISERTHWVYYITGKESPDYFNKLWQQ